MLYYAYYTGSNYHDRKEVRCNESKIKVKYYAQALPSQMLLENFEGFANVLMAETTNSKALEPCMLAEAKHCPD